MGMLELKSSVVGQSSLISLPKQREAGGKYGDGASAGFDFGGVRHGGGLLGEGDFIGVWGEAVEGGAV